MNISIDIYKIDYVSKQRIESRKRKCENPNKSLYFKGVFFLLTRKRPLKIFFVTLEIKNITLK